MYVYAHVCRTMSVCVHVFMYLYIFIYVCRYVCICALCKVCLCVCMYVCMYACLVWISLEWFGVFVVEGSGDFVMVRCGFGVMWFGVVCVWCGLV